MSELYHHGVKGMKWGVRKSDYKSMDRKQRKQTRKKYYSTPEGKITRATTIGTLIGGPLVGAIAGSITAKKLSSIPKQTIDKGRRMVEKYENRTLESDNQQVGSDPVHTIHYVRL